MKQTHEMSSQQRMADQILKDMWGQDLRAYLDEAIARGLSPERISRELAVSTGGIISVSFSTITRWLEHYSEETFE